MPSLLMTMEHQGGATVKEMMYRFRTGPPTSRKNRDKARQSGKAPKRMWYDPEEIRLKHSAAGAKLSCYAAKRIDS
jgi:hypothetical protein